MEDEPQTEETVAMSDMTSGVLVDPQEQQQDSPLTLYSCPICKRVFRRLKAYDVSISLSYVNQAQF